MNKQALKRIILAQIASDGGKGITYTLNSMPEYLQAEAQKAWNAGYLAKDNLMLQACTIVARHHEKDIRFFVTEDKEGVAKFIVYFDIYAKGTRWQVSFHSFNKCWKKWVKSSMPSRGHWDHSYARAVCIRLADLL